jgi:hypothetical protein
MEQLAILTRLLNDDPDEDIFTKSAETMKAWETDSEAEIIALQLSALSIRDIKRGLRCRMIRRSI